MFDESERASVRRHATARRAELTALCLAVRMMQNREKLKLCVISLISLIVFQKFPEMATKIIQWSINYNSSRGNNNNTKSNNNATLALLMASLINNTTTTASSSSSSSTKTTASTKNQLSKLRLIVIIFSKDRVFQLNECLRTFFQYVVKVRILILFFFDPYLYCALAE